MRHTYTHYINSFFLFKPIELAIQFSKIFAFKFQNTEQLINILFPQFVNFSKENIFDKEKKKNNRKFHRKGFIYYMRWWNGGMLYCINNKKFAVNRPDIFVRRPITISIFLMCTTRNIFIFQNNNQTLVVCTQKEENSKLLTFYISQE